MSRSFGAVAALWILLLLSIVWPDSGLGASLFAGWLRTTGPSLLGAAALLGAAWSLGRLVAPRLLPTPPEDVATGVVMEIALGMVALQGLAVVLAYAGLSAWGAAVIVPCLVGGVVSLARQRPRLPRVDPTTAVAAVAGAALFFPALFTIGAPPTGPDELQYHLRMPELLIQYGIHTEAEDPVSAFPRGLHAILALANGFGFALERSFALLLGLSGMLAGHRLASRIGGPLAGAFAILVMCGAPSALRMVPIVSTDVPLGLFLGASLLLLWDAMVRPDRLDARFALTLGLLGGAAFSIKYTAAVFFAPVWLVTTAVALRAERPRVVGALTASSLLPLLFAAPWLIANVTAELHPLYPFLGIDDDPAFRFNQTENYGAGGGILAWLRTPWDLFVLGTEFDRRHFLGRLGMWPLLALPGLVLVLRDYRARAMALVALLGFAVWAGPLRRVAYLLPLWPTIAALCGAGCAALVAGRGPATRALTLALTAGVAAAEVSPAWSDAFEDAAVAVGRADRDAVRDKRAESAPAWRWVRENTPPGSTIVTMFVWEVIADEHRVLWACAEECPTVRLRLAKAETGAAAAAMLADLGAGWILVKRQPFLRQSYPDMTDEQFAVGYEAPLRVLDELLSLHATEEFTSGLYGVYSLPNTVPSQN